MIGLTLIIALACQDGVVLASDGQVTVPSAGGLVRQPGMKIHPLGSHIIYGASGTLGFIQRVGNWLDRLPTEIKGAGLEALHDQIRNLVYQVRTQALQRHRGLYGQGTDSSAEMGDFLFAEHKAGLSCILRVNTDGNAAWFEKMGISALGIGDTFTYTILKNFPVGQLTIEAGKLLAYRTIKEAIDIGAFGLGEPIDIWTVTDEKGTQHVTPEEIAAIRDTYICGLRQSLSYFSTCLRVSHHDQTGQANSTIPFTDYAFGLKDKRCTVMHRIVKVEPLELYRLRLFFLPTAWSRKWIWSHSFGAKYLSH